MGSETIKIIKQLLCGLAALFPRVFYETLLPSLRSLSIILPVYVCCFPSPLTHLLKFDRHLCITEYICAKELPVMLKHVYIWGEARASNEA